MHVQGQRLFTGIVSDISAQVALRAEMNKAYQDLSLANSRLEELARTDKLTGLFNRGHFDETLHNEINRATRHRMPLSLLFLDVDYFKRFNDYYGHLDGDSCLREIASSLMAAFRRSGEVVARYGGEEFAIILPHHDVENATRKAEEVLQRVRELKIPHDKSTVSRHVTVSIGAVTWQPASNRPIESAELVKSADILLYAAKAGGRNQACHDKFTTTGASGRKLSEVKAHASSAR
jgi:diguanylate cyclase (GGDEF)-like protein